MTQKELDVLESGYRVANQYTIQRDVVFFLKWSPRTAEMFVKNNKR